MYILKSEKTFDSAHFLANYDGKCRYIHGHTWRVVAEVQSEELIADGACEGMVVDFGDLKNDLKVEVDYFDHSLIIQEGTLRDETANNLIEDGFKIVKVKFRTTAENFSKYFFDRLEEKGYNVKSLTVFETPTNSATYER